ncbi:MAG: Holliday junction resolvase Hjc [Candidatus Woesearchaeota archaeon]
MKISHGRRKAKGSAFERWLVHEFWKNGWGASRIAGSGSTRHLAPDIIAGKPGRVTVIEAKTTTEKTKYLTVEEVDMLIEYARAFGAEPWIAVKFKGNSIAMFPANSARRTEKSVIISKDDPLIMTFVEFLED